MKQHEREYFISRIRSGIYNLNIENKLITIKTPTIEDEYFINEKFKEGYERCLQDGVKTEDDILEWMRARELWTDKDDEREKGLIKDIDNLKKRIYENRHRFNLREQIRQGIRAGEKQLSETLEKKTKYLNNSCEGIANIGKVAEFFKRCTYINNELCDLDDLKIELISNHYYKALILEKDVRELARNEPWRSVWVLRDSGAYSLFSNQDRQLSPDQKSLLIWSRMYDNVHESPDCPSEEVINDDDMLDGWFSIQASKRKDAIMESELESKLSNSKIANSQEIFLMADSKQDAENINQMNTHQARMIKKQRFNQLQKRGQMDQNQFQDERLKMGQKSHEQFKDKFRR